MKVTRLLFIGFLCSIIMASSVQAKGITDVIKSIAQTLTEEEAFDEGVDTPIEVLEYKKYAGEHEDMFLKEGDHIALIAPSSIPAEKAVDGLMKGLSDWGYVPVKGKHITDAGRSLEDCIADLTWALEDPEIKAIFCIRGGYGATEVMDALTLDLLKESNKLIIGYSDITVFHSAWTSAELPSIHACMSAAFDGLSLESKVVEEKILKGEIPVYQCERSEHCIKGEAEGILIGGNLSTFAAVLGAAYDCTLLGKPYILFLEDVEEDYSHIHRLLTILKHCGVLDKAAGIIFGEWTDIPVKCSDYSGNSRKGDFTSVEDMIHRQFLQDVEVPVAFGFPAGHGNVNYPLLMGEKIKLMVGQDTFTVEWVY